MIEENLVTLKSINFGELLLECTAQEIDHQLVSYLDLLFNKNTGKIIEVAKGLGALEDSMVVTPIAIKCGESMVLEVIEIEKEVSDDIKHIIKESLKRFSDPNLV